MNGRASGYLINKFTRRLELHDRNTLRCRLKTGQRSFAYMEGLPAGTDFLKTLKNQ